MRERGKRRRTGRLPRSLRARTHRAAGLPGCLPTARLPFCGGKKNRAVALQLTAGASLGKKREGGGRNKSDAFTPASRFFLHYGGNCLSPIWDPSIEIPRRFAPCLFFFPRRVRDNRHGAAPTWPDCNDCAEVKRAHTEGGKNIFIWRSYPLN